MIGIYKITSPSGKIYIGSSKNIERRKEDYRYKRFKYQINQPKLISIEIEMEDISNEECFIIKAPKITNNQLKITKILW
jgi:predicted GIY-YIG superfamily endonuclease